MPKWKQPTFQIRKLLAISLWYQMMQDAEVDSTKYVKSIQGSSDVEINRIKSILKWWIEITELPLILTMPDLIFDSLISALIPRKIYDFFKALIS